MAAALAGESLSGRSSSTSRRFGSMRELWNEPDVFRVGSGRVEEEEDDEEALIWAAIERLPTFDRLRKGILKQVTDSGRVTHDEVNLARLEPQDKKLLVETILQIAEEDNEKFLRRLRDRIDRLVSYFSFCLCIFMHICYVHNE